MHYQTRQNPMGLKERKKRENNVPTKSLAYKSSTRSEICDQFSKREEERIRWENEIYDEGEEMKRKRVLQ